VSAERRIPRDRLGRPLPAGSRDELRSDYDPAVAEALPVSAVLRRVAKLFDERRFFEAHEWLEHLWKSPATPAEDRDFWQGLTQVAVGLCHCQRGNRRGAWVLLERAVGHLRRYPPPHKGIDTTELIAGAERAREALERNPTQGDLTFPPFPLDQE
jgi:predicted metal-dependent hydrolase